MHARTTFGACWALLAWSCGGATFPPTTATPGSISHSERPRLAAESIRPLRRVVHVAAGDAHTCAVFDDGRVACWGGVASEQVDSSARRIAQANPRLIAGIENATTLDAGGVDTCVLLRDQHIACFREVPGGLRSTPRVIDGVTDAVAIDVGSLHACAVRADHTVVCWGANSTGAFGIAPDALPRSERAVAVPQLSDVVEVTCGDAYTCARKSDGSVFCWGEGNTGALDGADRAPSLLPVRIGIARARALEAGSISTCAITEPGSVTCWGAYDTADPHAPPLEYFAPFVRIEAPDEGGVFAELAVNRSNVCARLASGPIRCARLGDYRDDPLAAPAESHVAEEVTLGARHACIRTRTGGVGCWGDNGVGQCGNEGTRDGSYPRQVVDLRDVVAFSTGGFFTCAVTDSGQTYCWGRQTSMELGTFAAAEERNPRPILVPHVRLRTLSSGDTMTCGLAFGSVGGRGGSVTCWGDSQTVFADDSAANERGAPASVPNIDDALAVSAALGHISVVRANGDLVAWGRHAGGDVAGAVTRRVSAAIDVVANAWGQGCVLDRQGRLECFPGNVVLADVIHFDVRDEGAMAVLRDGTARFWVGGTHTWLAGDPVAWAPTPVRGVAAATSVALGETFGCVTTRDGHVVCFGSELPAANEFGQLGRGHYEVGGAAARVVGLDHVVAIDAGNSHACALRDDRTLHCWGSNEYGQLGDGTLGGPPPRSFSVYDGRRPANVSFDHLR